MHSMWEEIQRGGKGMKVDKYSCNTAGMCLKRLLLSRDPIIPYEHYDTLMAIQRTARGAKGALLCISEVIRKLPIGNAVVLYKLLLLLEQISEHRAITGSDAAALGYTFGPALLRRRTLPTSAQSALDLMNLATEIKFVNELIVIMIEGIDSAFDSVPAIANYNNCTR
eukprot:m51a1_g9001 hypothetical protein (168) ;mRNA; r:106027-106530